MTSQSLQRRQQRKYDKDQCKRVAAVDRKNAKRIDRYEKEVAIARHKGELDDCADNPLSKAKKKVVNILRKGA